MSDEDFHITMWKDLLSAQNTIKVKYTSICPNCWLCHATACCESRYPNRTTGISGTHDLAGSQMFRSYVSRFVHVRDMRKTCSTQRKSVTYVTWGGGGRSFISVVTVTLNTFRPIGDDIEYRLDVCRTATWLPTYRFIKNGTFIVFCFVSYFTTYCILNVGDTSSVTLYYLGYEINTDRLRETRADNTCMQHFTLKT